MKKRFLLLVLCLLLIPTTALAQEDSEGINLRLTRDWGYGGFNGDIQGTFSMRVTGPDDLARVEYYMDDQVIHEITTPPFNFQFNTDNFDPGTHTLYAIGYTTDGRALQSKTISPIFLSAEEAGKMTKGIIVPILVVVGIAVLLGVLVPVVFGRKQQYKPGVYSPAGGAICPRCTFPYSRSLFSPNILVGKLCRCPHCGKWAIAPRASAIALEAAEERLASEGLITIEMESEEEKLRKTIDESRFEE
jgi:hypothetical protein